MFWERPLISSSFGPTIMSQKVKAIASRYCWDRAQYQRRLLPTPVALLQTTAPKGSATGRNNVSHRLALFSRTMCWILDFSAALHGQPRLLRQDTLTLTHIQMQCQPQCQWAHFWSGVSRVGLNYVSIRVLRKTDVSIILIGAQRHLCVGHMRFLCERVVLQRPRRNVLLLVISGLASVTSFPKEKPHPLMFSRKGVLSEM
jgi:hypothetical protein